MRRNRILAAAAGLALSAAAHAQLQIVTSQPGTWVTGVDVPANLLAGSQGDDFAAAITIPAAYATAVLNAGANFATTNGRLINLNNTSFSNVALVAAGPFGYYPHWDDLHTGHQTAASPASGIYARDTGTAFVVQWNFDAFTPANSGIPSGALGYASMQVQIFQTGSSVVAQYLYQNMGTMTGQSATIGSVSQTGAQVLQYSLNTPGSVGDTTVLSIVPLSTATGACCRIDGTCAAVTQFICTSGGGVYSGDNTTCATTNCAPAGACCLPSTLSCSFVTSAACTAGGGTWAGAGVTCAAANCPTPGACCMADGTCTQSLPAACTAAQGTYRGDSTLCAAQNCPVTGYVEGTNDAGDTPATAAVLPSLGTALTLISGATGASTDADMYLIRICDPANFSATTIGGSGTLSDTQLFLFNTAGVGITADDDDPLGTGGLRSRLSSANVASLPAGNFYLAVSGYNLDPQDASAQLLWLNTPFNVERIPDGLGAANPVASWVGSESLGTYNILLTGSCFPAAAASCYANCDASTTPPVLNVLDFGCFLNRFAAGCSGC